MAEANVRTLVSMQVAGQPQRVKRDGPDVFRAIIASGTYGQKGQAVGDSPLD